MIQIAQRPAAATFAKAAAVVLLAILAFALTACSPSGGKETKAVFEMQQNGVNMTLTYFANGDEVTKQTTVNVVNYADSGLADADEARSIFDPLVADFQGVTGLEHEIVYGEKEATETLTVDYTKANLAEIAELTGSSFSGNVEDGAKLSLEQSRQMLLDSGFKEVK